MLDSSKKIGGTVVIRLFAAFMLGLILGISSLVFYYHHYASGGFGGSALEANLPEISVGEKTAPIVVTEYSSVGCFHCADFRANVLPKLKEKFMDTGRVKWIMRSFPLGGADLRVMMLSYCTANPLDMLNHYYFNQPQWLLSADPNTVIDQMAAEKGLTKEQIEGCVKNEPIMNAIINQRMQAQARHGISATPAFIIGATMIPGLMPLEHFEKVLEKAEEHVKSGNPIETFSMDLDTLLKNEGQK